MNNNYLEFLASLSVVVMSFIVGYLVRANRDIKEDGTDE